MMEAARFVREIHREFAFLFKDSLVFVIRATGEKVGVSFALRARQLP
jgi:hypothetical protein